MSKTPELKDSKDTNSSTSVSTAVPAATASAPSGTVSQGASNFLIFDRELKDMFTLMKKIIETRDIVTRRNKNTVDPLIVFMNKYIKTYEMMKDKEDHKIFILDIYVKNRSDILKGMSADEWLQKTKPGVVVQFGTRVLQPEKLNREIRLDLTGFYSIALKLKSLALNRLEGLPVEEYSNCAELNYPNEILLHLYRLFRESLNSDEVMFKKYFKELLPTTYIEDRGTLLTLIHNFEDELGLPRDEAISTGNTTNSGMVPDLNGIGGAVSQIMGHMGITDTKLPPGSEFNNFVNNFTNDPKAKELFSEVGAHLKKLDKNPDEALKGIFGMLNNGSGADLTKHLKTVVETTVETHTENKTITREPAEEESAQSHNTESKKSEEQSQKSPEVEKRSPSKNRESVRAHSAELSKKSTVDVESSSKPNKTDKKTEVSKTTPSVPSVAMKNQDVETTVKESKKTKKEPIREEPKDEEVEYED